MAILILLSNSTYCLRRTSQWPSERSWKWMWVPCLMVGLKSTNVLRNEEIPQRNHHRRVSSLNKSLVKSRRPVSHHRNLGKNDWSSARPNGVRQESANQLSNVKSDKSKKVHIIPIDLKVSHVHFDFYRLVIVTFISAVLFVSSVVFCVCANLSFLFPYPSFFFKFTNFYKPGRVVFFVD